MLINTIKKAYSYIRFSSPQQAEGDSLRRQVERSQKYAKEHGLTLDTTLDLHDEGLSGYTGANRKKGALGMFLAAVETGLVTPGSTLIVESLDRLSRDKVIEQLNLFLSLITADITLVTLIDNQIYNRESIDANQTMIMISLVSMMRAHDESRHKSDRLLSVWAGKRKRADQQKMTAQCPAWLTLAPDRKSFIPNENRVAVLKRIYQLSNDGIGHHRIAKILNTERVPHWGARITPMLSLASFKNIGLFVLKLRHPKDPVSEFLAGKLAEVIQRIPAAQAQESEIPEELQSALVVGLNQIIKGAALYEETRFAGFKLRPKAEKILSRGRELRPKELANLNRMLLEDVFPDEIKPGNGWHESFVLALLRTRAVLGEFQPHRRERTDKRRAVPVGDPIPNYYPAVIALETWQRAQSRRKTSTPGRTGTYVPNLFAGLIWDAHTGAAMRFVSRSPRRDANGHREGRWHYLSSDFARLSEGAKARSWRYEWFESWFLNFVCELDWGTVVRQQVPQAELEMASRIATLTNRRDELSQSLERLITLAATTSNPPKRLLEEMVTIEGQKLDVESKLKAVQSEADETAARRNSMNDSVEQIKQLAAKGDPTSRLRLREELRRKINRITVYCDGVPKALTEGMLDAPGWVGFQVTFVNGVERLVLCPGKKPVEGSSDAVILDACPEEVTMPEMNYPSERTVLKTLQSEDKRPTDPIKHSGKPKTSAKSKTDDPPPPVPVAVNRKLIPEQQDFFAPA